MRFDYVRLLMHLFVGGYGIHPYDIATILFVRFNKAIGEIREDGILLYTLSVMLSHAIRPRSQS